MNTKNMASINFDTKNLSFKELLSPSYNYTVPPFQRDYSWDINDWSELWQDIMNLLEEDPNPFHYMGYLVLQTEDAKNYKIIDGQQRIATISILILAACSQLAEMIENGEDVANNDIRKKQFLDNYIGYTDPVLICRHTKLHLNKHNNNYYQTYMATLSALPSRNINASESRLRKSFLFFQKEIKQFIYEKDNKGKEIAELIEFITDKLNFTTITVNNDINAFKVFETLNARGVKLSSADLLKNYIFSLLTNESTHNNALSHLESRWERIVSSIGDDDLTEIVRIYWNSKNKLVRKKELFKTIKNSVLSKESAFNFLTGLDEAIDIYLSLIDTRNKDWNNDEQKYLTNLFEVFNVKQPMSMLISVYKAFYKKEHNEFVKILKYVSVITFRYNVICSMLPHEQERVYSEVSLKVSSGEYNAKQALQTLKNKLLPSDDVFNNAFTGKVIKTGNNRNTKLIKYILGEIEKRVSGGHSILDSEMLTVEHILPKNPNDDWDIEEPKIELLPNQIGNMCLLPNSSNRNLGNKDFATKSVIYRQSSIHITNYIGENYNYWGEKQINERQKFFAKVALEIWRLD
ncbi:DUF262 domain-containing protein [Rosenbergiella sp. S61]|uniref:DUF262 domain-containing protein n=1 Tax=Rosenbergiella gaditana TaxID=2726987 RepID=A0ABS5T1W1_9GAMM|nr:DUF262 domain-containing protein [Rosenbergiella gaditana]MBT0725447.1 DUF262 domain-containing protein [Rosenbergiella gaditana]